MAPCPATRSAARCCGQVIRRAVRFGYQVLDIREPFLHKLVPLVTNSMGEAFPELESESRSATASIRKEEEDAFMTVIDRGLRVFEDAAGAAATPAGQGLPGHATSSTCTPRSASRPT